ncbi:hypothetical protein JCM19241_3644 [Vibrio ishigakensis]|uniref:Uncharacterized protein n=1 Tax=Vibrio ishigakensis TaxID=1481914 RepID=A0A0B8QF97_9VIBR|nr:hypothetical protein JCM19241_3644 [Vibrio ishigakensis]
MSGSFTDATFTIDGSADRCYRDPSQFGDFLYIYWTVHSTLFTTAPF